MQIDKIKYDVIVCGGGMAGVVAAIAAARLGAQTLLIEKHNCSGGVMTSGILSLLGPLNDKHQRVILGIPAEIVDRLADMGGSKLKSGFIPINHEMLKLLLDRMLEESGVKVLYHSLAVDAQMQGSMIDKLMVANKGGIMECHANMFVDGTGDGDVAFKAGCKYEMGRKKDGWMQPLTTVCRLGGVDPKVYKFEDNFTYSDDIKKALASGEMTIPADGIGAACFVPGMDGVIAVNMSHIYGVDPTSPEALSRAEMIGREQAQEIASFFQKYVTGCKKAFLVDTSTLIGIRESRRFIGEYVLTVEDVVSGRRFEDAVVANAYHLDIHNEPDDKRLEEKKKGLGLGFPKQYYHIPYRCLLPKGADNLLVSGRCISTTHEALSSTRIGPCCMAIGQAAGTAAALCAKDGILPGDLKIDILRATLLKNKVFING
ncbi:MAG: FAD-dependent oxidoreductase [Kiritimatiellaeota bacterium]|nr:FAD-dependent oxidoreductase [Kiritimatiellota bacterium]